MTATKLADNLLTCATKTAKSALSALALTTVAFGLSAPAAASDWGVHAPHVQADSMHVDLNQTHVLRLPRPASAVVVGNPSVADIAVHTTDTILVLGRNYGTTNILAFDSSGAILSETRVNVGEVLSDSRLRIYQGANMRRTYQCNGECVPAPAIGDDLEFREANINAPQRTVTDTVVSRAGTNFGNIAGNPFSQAPSTSPPAAVDVLGADSPGLPFAEPTDFDSSESYSSLD